MVWRLVAHAIRRTGRTYALASFSFLAWWVATVRPSADRASMAVSLAVAFVIGPVMAIASLSSREIALLPVSRRHLWLAQWLLGTVVAVAVNTLAKLLGTVATPHWLESLVPIDLATLALSAACDFLYCGAFIGMLAIAGTRLAGRVRYRRTVSSALYVVAVVAFIGGIAWPFLMAGLLPLRWADLAGPAGVAPGIGLLLTVAGYRYVPRASARASDRPKAATSQPAASLFHWRDVLSVGTTSLRTLVAREVLLVVAFVAGWIGLIVAAQMLPPGRAGVLDALAGAVQPFGEAPIRAFGGALPWLHPAWFAVLAMSGRNVLVPIVRVLRAQPISTWRLNALLLALSLPVLIVLAAAVSAVEVLALNRPPSIAPGALLLFAGCTALGHAWQLRTGVQTPFLRMPFVVFFLVGTASLALRRVPSLHALADPAALGAMAFVAGAVLNYFAIARRSATYRPAVPGLDFPGAVRRDRRFV